MNIQDKIDTLTRELEAIAAKEQQAWALYKAEEEKANALRNPWNVLYTQKDTLTRQIEALKGLL